MSSSFQSTTSNTNAMGASYPYWKNINNPDEIGMTANGSISALGTDIDGLISYVELLVTGTGSASKTGQPLGNKYFLQTAAKCTPNVCPNASPDASCNPVSRYIYVNNVPGGNIPFISAGMGQNFSTFRGLIPGTMSDLNVLNPGPIFSAFTAGNNPPCQEITLQTIDINNNVGTDTQFVTLNDIKGMDPCNFGSGGNPLTGQPCKQAFTNISSTASPLSYGSVDLPKDPVVQIFFISSAILAIYMIYCVMLKHRHM